MHIDSINSVEDTTGNNGERGYQYIMLDVCICNTCYILYSFLFRDVDYDEFNVALDITFQFKDKFEHWTEYDRFC